MSDKLNFYDFTVTELESWFRSQDLPAYRARQLFTNVYQRRVTDPAEMTDLPKSLRGSIAEHMDLAGPPLSKVLESATDASVKFLWKLPDGKEIESVLMQADYGETVCFSTQVGCAFGCTFCITAKMGKLRNLTAGEIVSQVVQAADRRPPTDRGINLVAMGMGEPMDNLDAVLKAVEILGHPMGLNISGRRLTISTVGVVPGILRLAEENPGIALALSLNATTNEVRREIMPVTRKYPIEAVLEAVQAYAAASRHRVTLEYVLIRGLNDTMEDADRLGEMAESFPSKVNVIPFNPSELFPYERPTAAEVDRFAHRLGAYRVPVTVRYSKGLDILAACGQLGYDQVRSKAEKP